MCVFTRVAVKTLPATSENQICCLFIQLPVAAAQNNFTLETGFLVFLNVLYQSLLQLVPGLHTPATWALS